MRRALLAAAILASTLPQAVRAAPTYVALGASITFGKPDSAYVQWSRDRGYIIQFANTLAGRNGGARPGVVNLTMTVRQHRASPPAWAARLQS